VVVLVLDGSAGGREVLCRSLRSAGFEPVEAAGMQEAREIVRTHALTAGVIDLGEQGAGVVRELEESTNGIPLVVCTDDESARRGPLESMLIEAGAESVVIKSREGEDLGSKVVAEVRRGLARRQRDRMLERHTAREMREMFVKVVGLVEQEYAQTGDRRPARAEDEPSLIGQRPEATEEIPAPVTVAAHPLVTTHRARMAAIGALLATLLGSCAAGLVKQADRLPW